MHDLKKLTAAFLAAALIFPQGAIAEQAASAPASFQGVDVSDDFVTIRLSTGVSYNSFLTQTPPRLVVELLDTKDESVMRSVQGRGKSLAGVRSSQFQKTPRLITRVVFDLIEMAKYNIETDAAGMIVRFGAPLDTAKVPPEWRVPAQNAGAPRGPGASVASEASNSGQDVDKNLSVAAAFKRAGLEGKMRTELVAGAQNENLSNSTAVIPENIGDGRTNVRTLGGRIYQDALSRLPTDPITLDFDNTDVRDVIKLLAAKAQINIVYSSEVSGTLTLHLANAPFNEAFHTVLSLMSLATEQAGYNILRVIPATRALSISITKVIPLNYAKAAAVKTAVDSVRTAEGRVGNSSIDANTNSLIVTETLEGMQATENLINQLDQRPRQVLIEAKLIEIKLSNLLDYGIQWNYASASNSASGTNTIGTTAGPTAGTAGSLTSGGVTTSGISSTGGIGAAGAGTGVSLPADNIFGALTLGRITNNYLVNATISAAASEGKAKVLSDPKIATLNNQPANVNVTTQIPYVTSNVASTGVQTQSVSYVTEGIQLTVTPSINADGRILLVLNPNISQPSVTAAANTQTGAPAVDTRNAQTTVLVRDGETIVIGGLISDNVTDTIAKIPLLGDIPILGWLFKKKSTSRTRNELLIFVAAHVLPD